MQTSVAQLNDTYLKWLRGFLGIVKIRDSKLSSEAPSALFRLRYAIARASQENFLDSNAGCELRLLTTWQTITMNPDDYVVINHRVMEYKEN